MRIRSGNFHFSPPPEGMKPSSPKLGLRFRLTSGFNFSFFFLFIKNWGFLGLELSILFYFSVELMWMNKSFSRDASLLYLGTSPVFIY